jgi:hypothetical protein
MSAERDFARDRLCSLMCPLAWTACNVLFIFETNPPPATRPAQFEFGLTFRARRCKEFRLFQFKALFRHRCPTAALLRQLIQILKLVAVAALLRTSSSNTGNILSASCWHPRHVKWRPSGPISQPQASTQAAPTRAQALRRWRRSCCTWGHFVSDGDGRMTSQCIPSR